MRLLAFDLGASSGRAIAGSFDGSSLTTREIHRFSNDPVDLRGVLSWDLPRLMFEIRAGLQKAAADGEIDSIGVDTWGVDFGLLDRDGDLLAIPTHYRDAGNSGMTAKLCGVVPAERIYSLTGIQFMDLNTSCQLLRLRTTKPYLFDAASGFLFMPDLINYMLTGVGAAEYSIATTSQLVDIGTGDWSGELIDALDIPRRLFPAIVPSGARLGRLLPGVREMTGAGDVPVVAVCGHDTQSAVTAVPASDDDFVFISSGTWSLMGCEVAEAHTDRTAFEFNITNEGGFGGTTTMLKNICGLWLIQESRRQYAREGVSYSYAELESEARKAAPFACFIDPDSPEFASPGNTPARVRAYCERTGQRVPQSVGEVIRCIYESLALKYRVTLEGIRRVTGRDFSRIHVVGGGTKDTFLNAMTASSCAKTVLAGPVEATVMGNLAVQLISSGELSDVAEARRLISSSVSPDVYEPTDVAAWDDALKEYLRVTGGAV